MSTEESTWPLFEVSIYEHHNIHVEVDDREELVEIRAGKLIPDGNSFPTHAHGCSDRADVSCEDGKLLNPKQFPIFEVREPWVNYRSFGVIRIFRGNGGISVDVCEVTGELLVLVSVIDGNVIRNAPTKLRIDCETGSFERFI